VLGEEQSLLARPILEETENRPGLDKRRAGRDRRPRVPRLPPTRSAAAAPLPSRPPPATLLRVHPTGSAAGAMPAPLRAPRGEGLGDCRAGTLTTRPPLARGDRNTFAPVPPWPGEPLHTARSPTPNRGESPGDAPILLR